MALAQDIIVKTPGAANTLDAFSTKLSKLTLGEKIREVQSLNEDEGETSAAKLLFMYIASEEEIRFEIKRIFSWKSKKEKIGFLISQFSSSNKEVLLVSIHLLGVLKEPIAIPYLDEIFKLEDTALCAYIIATLGEIGNPLGIKTVQKGLKSTDRCLLILAIRTLSGWRDDVQWRQFKPLLFHGYKEVRAEAAFAIALRKSSSSASSILKAIRIEKDPGTRHLLIQYAGMIPSSKILMPMLHIVTEDDDQKARFIASRSIDRLQGLLRPRELFSLRNVSNPKIKAEIIFRLGKFGTDSDRYKNYIRTTLKKTKEPLIVQACLQALGYIAEHEDVSLLTEFLGKDPLSSYNALMALTHTWRTDDKDDVHQMLNGGLLSAYGAAMALTRTWRMEDKDSVLSSITGNLSATQKQVIIKYMIRRRGLLLEPAKILKTVQNILSKDDNINVRYLSIALLEFAPSTETITFLIDLYLNAKENFELEATKSALSQLAIYHRRFIISFISTCKLRDTGKIISFIPADADIDYFRDVAKALFAKLDKDIGVKAVAKMCYEIFDLFMSNPKATKLFIKSLPNAMWQRLFIDKLLHAAKASLIEEIEDELIPLLAVPDDGIRTSVMQLVIAVKNPGIIPRLMTIAESKKDTTSAEIAKNIIKNYIEEHVI